MPNAHNHTQCEWIHARTYTPRQQIWQMDVPFSYETFLNCILFTEGIPYWWPLNLALAVGLVCGRAYVRMSESAHEGTLTFMLTHRFDLNICDEQVE